MSGGRDTSASVRRARLIAIGYAVLAALWFLGSDWLVAMLVPDEKWRMQVSDAKGWLFIGLSSALLYGVLRKNATTPPAGPAGKAATLRRAPLLLGGATIVLLTALAVRYEFTQHLAQQAAELESVGAYRAQALGNAFKTPADWAEALHGGPMLAVLEGWPVPRRTAASILLRREGEMLVGVLGRRPLQLSTPGLLAARALRGEIPMGRVTFGYDSRGVEVYGAVLPVPGSEWFLVSRIDAAELRAGSLKNATWICAAGGLALIGLLAAGFLGRERRALGMAQDLQRLQAERLHALSLVQSIAEASSDAIFAKDLDGRYLLCNREACRLLGVTPQTVLGADDHSLFPPEQADLLRNNDARVLVDNAVRSYEESLSTRDGERIFLVIKGPLHDEQGHVVGVFGISRDITDREHQRTSLAEAENTQRLLLAAMGDGMFVAQDHRFLFSNPALPRMLGREPAGFVDVPFAEVVAPESLAQWTERFEARVGDGPEPDRHYEVQFLRAGGPSRIWIDLRATRMELKGRRAVLGLVTDITERRRTAQALVHATELLRAVEDSLLDQLAVIDQQGCITAVNEAWRRFARDNGRVEGAPDDIGRDYFSVCGDDPLGREVVLGLRAVLDGSSAHFHIVYPCHSPSRERWFQLDATPLSMPGGGAVVMHSDITALRQANDELDRHRNRLQDLVDAQTLRLQDAIAELLQSRNRAEAANHAKSAFLANMSHEIRTPMNAIIGLNYLVRRDGVTPAQASRLNKIDSAGQHLLAIINDILDLSKIEAGRVQIETIDFALSDVLDGVASIIAESARAKGLAITVDSNAVPPWLRGDPTRLRQALLNFAGNAVKFTESGSITLNAKMLRDGGNEMLVQFSVTDTGIGIAAEKIPRLFKPFEQADASITRKFGGTGLGLAITKRLADLMQGECGVHSEEGIGSTFWFTAIVNRGHLVLPVASPECSSTDRDLMREYHRDARLLLAEDNEVNREVALAMLDGVGLSVDVATNGQEAVAMARENRYDLILMDMQMPEMSGLEATRAIRQLPGWATQPILALTANAFDDDRLACKAAGMNDFIVKPINVDALYSTILKWLDAAVEKAD